MSSHLDELFSDIKGDSSAQIDRQYEFTKAFEKALANPGAGNISKDILGGAFTNAPGGGTAGTPGTPS